MAATADDAPATRAPVDLSLVLMLVGLLFISNIMANAVLPEALYVPWNLGVAALIVLLCRRSGLGWADLGISRLTLGRSARWGAIGAGVVIAIYLIGLALPLTRSLFEDDRAESEGILALLYHVGLQVPLGTVILEEVAFRGALPAALGLRGVRTWLWAPALWSSLLFGLWHILPSVELASANEGVGDATGGSSLLAIIGAVIATFVAGLVLSRARWVGRGLLTPMLIHFATNGIGLVIAWFAIQAPG